VICTHQKELGKQVVAGLANHPFQIAEVENPGEIAVGHPGREPEVIGLVLPADARKSVAEVRKQYPVTPIVLVTESGKEIQDAPRLGSGRIDELKSATALQEICWWVANEVAKPKELASLVEHQIRPVLMELNGQAEVLPDLNLRNLWIFPGPCPQGGDSLMDWVQAEDRALFFQEMKKAEGNSLRVFTLRIRHGTEEAHVVEAGLRWMRADRFLLVLQPLIQGGPVAWQRLATHDPLTGLLNRWEMSRRLEKMAPAGDPPLCLLYLDLDHFKSVNDTLGSHQADEVLVRVANLIRELFPAPCLISRFMGDEFLVLAPGQTVQEVKAKAESLQEKVGGIRIAGFSPDFRLGISGGIVEVQERDHDTALRRAEAALHQAKEGGRNRVFIHRQERIRPAAAQQMLEGLNRGEFVPWLQMVVDARTEKPAFYEALARYHSAEGRWMSPVHFLRMRETQGLVSRMDRAIFIQTLNLLFEHPQARISVNLSAESFALAPFPGCFLGMARDAAVETERILVEISEECMKLPKELVLERVRRMRDVGIEVLLDDFGGGLSPLSYLSDFPFAMVKLDGNLTLGVETSPVKEHFLRAVVEMAQSRGMKTVAEYVANGAQKECLVGLGVDYLQGYLFGTPSAPEVIFGKRKTTPPPI
jgi:diguanylate cyclase (GGDEF)-like protein